MFVCDHCERKGSLRQYVFDWLGILQILRGGEVRISLINNQIRGTISVREVVVTITLKEVVIFIIVIRVLITSQAPVLSRYIDYKKGMEVITNSISRFYICLGNQTCREAEIWVLVPRVQVQAVLTLFRVPHLTNTAGNISNYTIGSHT